MATKTRQVDVGTDRGRRIVAALAGEIRAARLDRGLSQAEIARATGLSQPTISRLEHAQAEAMTILDAARMLAVLGLELSARAYPSGEPIRDAAHAALLGRLRSRLHRTLRFRTEVPLPSPADLRAWDAVIVGPGWTVGVEAETRPRDLQALERRLALKQRDSRLDLVLLLLLDSRHDRALVRDHADALTSRFPVPGRRALQLLGVGASPGGSSIVLL